MNEPHSAMILVEGRIDPGRAGAAIAGGRAVAYSARAPDKETENEDTAAILPYGPGAVVLVVADGVGGMPGGSRASETAIRTLARSLEQSRDETTQLRTAILNGIEAANDAVRELGNGSATTLTIVTLEGRLARTYQVGDSEAIITGQRGRLRAQTLPHSPTGFAVEAGFLDHRDALHHEDRHLLSNMLGTADMRIDIGATVELNPRDTVILATDGLTDNLHIDEIVDYIRKGPLDQALENVTRAAHRRMTVESKTLPSKPDDLTVILFRRDPPASARRGPSQGEAESSA